MKNLILFLLTLFLTVGIILPSCNIIDGGLDCNCPPISGEFFRIKDLSLNNQTANGGQLAANETVKYDNYILRINIDPEFYAFKKQKKNWSFSLINSALACSCVFDGISGAKEKIEELTIITKNDFSDNYMDNDTISSQFEIFDYYVGENESIEDFVNRELNLAQFEGFALYLKNPPILNTEFKIELIIKLDNGEEFIVENEPIIIE